MLKNYSIIGQIYNHSEIKNLKKLCLNGNRYSSIEQPSVTLLFTGLLNSELIQHKMSNQSCPKFYLLEEIIRKLIVQYQLPNLKLAIKDVIRLGDSNNCLALSLMGPSLFDFYQDLFTQTNQLNIFDPIISKYSFSAHITIGYKRLDNDTFREFKDDLLNLINRQTDEMDKDLLKNILNYIERSPLSQITNHVKLILLKYGFSPIKLTKYQSALSISDTELMQIKAQINNYLQSSLNLELQSIICIERPVLNSQCGYSQRSLFDIGLMSLNYSLSDPFLCKILKEFPIYLQSKYQSILFLTGSRSRGTNLIDSDWDIFLFIFNYCEIDLIRHYLKKISSMVFGNELKCQRLNILEGRHSVGLKLLDGNRWHQIDLVPILNGFTEFKTPFKIFDNHLKYWKPCNPRQTRLDLDLYSDPLHLRRIIKMVKYWNLITGSRLKSFHIERMLIKMAINDQSISFQSACHFISNNLMEPMIYDDPKFYLNGYLNDKLDNIELARLKLDLLKCETNIEICPNL